VLKLILLASTAPLWPWAAPPAPTAAIADAIAIAAVSLWETPTLGWPCFPCAHSAMC